jgi:hypothetical protein
MVLGFTIFISTMTMVGIQASALKTIAVDDCKYTGAIVLPGKFVRLFFLATICSIAKCGLSALLSIGYVHFVFGLDTTIRSLRRAPFSNRHAMAPVISIAAVVALLIPTMVVARTAGYDEGKCFGSIAFRASSLRLNRAIIATLALLITSALVMATIIALQLLKTVHMDPNERVTASRMVYYLVASTILQVRLIRPMCRQGEGRANIDFQDVHNTVFHPGLFQHHGR